MNKRQRNSNKLVSNNNNITLQIILLLILFNISNASVLNTRYLPFFIGCFLISYQIMFQKFFFGKKFILLVCAWIAINLSAIILLNVRFFVPRLIINTINLLFLPYLFLRIMGSGFWVSFEKWIYRLTIISLPLWLLNNLFPQIFIGLLPYFERVTSPNFLANKNYWSAFIYTHGAMDNGYGILRNCGFMWEPGAFSFMIIVAIIYTWLKNDKMVFNTRIWVYTLALASTFSTAGYFAYIFILMGNFIKKLTIWNIVLMILSIGLFYSVVYELDFISSKINKYNEEFIEDPTGESGNIGHKVNRFQGGVAAVIRTWKFPIGYGLVSANEREDEEYAYGTNGLGSLLEMWGFFLFPIIIYLIYRSLWVFNKVRKKALTINLFFVAIMVVFFSNPIHRNLTTYFLIITPLVLSAKSMIRYRKPVKQHFEKEYMVDYSNYAKIDNSTTV